MSEANKIFQRLAEPFSPKEIHKKTVRGIALEYIEARSVMNRLDEVVGPLNWSAEFRWHKEETKGPMTLVTVECWLTIVLENGKITRQDVGGSANPDPIVARKGGISDSFKRAAVQLGIGRHLYGVGIPEYSEAEVVAPEPTEIPPQSVESPSKPKPTTKERGQVGKFNLDVEPTTSKALYAWLKGLEEANADAPWAKGLAYAVPNHFKKLGWDANIMVWSQEQIAEAVTYVNGLRKMTAEEFQAHKKGRVEAAKAAKSAKKPNGIEYDSNGFRITPLTMNEKATPKEAEDMANRLGKIAGETKAEEFANALIFRVGKSGFAPHLENCECDWQSAVEELAVFYKHWPELIRNWASELKRSGSN